MAFCVFNNTKLMNVTIVDSETLYCSSPRLPNNLWALPAEQMFYEVRVTIDGKSSSSTTFKKFSYYFDSELSGVESDMGPITGGTDSKLIGKGFMHPNVCNLKVRYGAIEVTPKSINSTFVITTSPMVNLPGAIVLSTSGNGQNYANDITLHFRDKENTFTYIQDILVDQLHPQRGPVIGGTKVSVHGIGFAPMKNIDGSENTSKPIYYRVLTESGAQIGNVTQVDDLTKDSFNWHSPPCPAESKKITLQISWNKQNW